jgi:hypothetical protein
MKYSIDEFIQKYNLDDFKEKLELQGKEKLEFYNDLEKIFKTFVKILDNAANIPSIRGLLLLMGLAKLNEFNEVINKSDIKDILNIDRLEKLSHAFDYLEKNNFIKVKEKTPRFHIVKLNKMDNPGLQMLEDLIIKYWESPKNKKSKVHDWVKKNE